MKIHWRHVITLAYKHLVSGLTALLTASRINKKQKIIYVKTRAWLKHILHIIILPYDLFFQYFT